ncbi:hypothetical protein [Sulfuracidifex tepidarius]|uniref:Uncharacterized protein n=1 Tax=Sulfuracidifex tepidarius TaxID=1294262 RepID=A0A510E479_9CREN|nr:hypothetical protein [Sulfuracidifex tepidarius]BBG24544.1 hypothetical protein IC006_1869 [Sulfuracidifex tepidarius]BBG27332.1 hypothetical protein IC007_1877 [Sulfuracidifex tepidarius]
MSEIIKDLTGKALSKLGYTNVNNLDIKYYQEFKDRYDVFGQFRNERGYFEFAISFDKKVNIKRSHVNMISPSGVREDIEKKVYDK